MASTRRKINGVWRTVDDRTGKPVWDSQVDGEKLTRGTRFGDIANNSWMQTDAFAKGVASAKLSALGAGVDSSRTLKTGESRSTALGRVLAGNALAKISGGSPEEFAKGADRNSGFSHVFLGPYAVKDPNTGSWMPADEYYGKDSPEDKGHMAAWGISRELNDRMATAVTKSSSGVFDTIQRSTLSNGEKGSAMATAAMSMMDAVTKSGGAHMKAPAGSEADTFITGDVFMGRDSDSAAKGIVDNMVASAKSAIDKDPSVVAGVKANAEAEKNRFNSSVSQLESARGNSELHKAVLDNMAQARAERRQQFADQHAAFEKQYKETQDFLKNVNAQLGIKADARGGRSSVRAASKAGAPKLVAPADEYKDSVLYVPTGEMEYRYIGPSLQTVGWAGKKGMMTALNLENPDATEMVIPIPEGATVMDDGEVLTPVNVPEGAISVGGNLYRPTPVVKNRLLSLSQPAKDAYDRIQAEFAMANGRAMDRDVASIRALMATGEVSKEEAKRMAWELRRDRDVSLATQLAKANGGSYEDYYIPTTRDTLGLGKSLQSQDAIGKALLESMNTTESNVQLARAYPEAYQRNRRKNLFLAHRYGLSPELASRDPEEVTVDLAEWRRAYPAERLNQDGLSFVPSLRVNDFRPPARWEVTGSDDRSPFRSERRLSAAERKLAGEEKKLPPYGRARKGWDPTRDGAPIARASVELDSARRQHARNLKATGKAKRYRTTGRWVLPSSAMADPTFRRIDVGNNEDLFDTLYILNDR